MKLGIIFVFIAMLAESAFGRAIVLRPGESQQIVCSDNGGGGGGNLSCVQQLSDWCYSNTSMNRDQCFAKASAYCPSTSYASCVSDTANYCYSNTSMNRDQCFETALGSCRGHPENIRNLLDSVKQGAALRERGIDLEALKIEPSVHIEKADK